MTGPVPGPGTGPHTPPLPWPAVVLTAEAPEAPAGAPAWRRALHGLAPARLGAVGHRTAAVAVGATFMLAVAAVVTTSAGTGEGTGGNPAGPPAEAPVAAPPDLVAGTRAADPATFGATPSFTSPTGNIACRIDDGAARCDVEDRTWTPRGASGCAEAGLVVDGAARARATCDGTPARPGGTALRYGTHVTHGDLTCVSRRSGVECRDARSGHGFVASRASYRLY
ncbi:hypothetical protein H7X46_11055 [Pseudonocardia sp. C8]|uniref:hypothetical protein n=1 Tax=Pseudonocardia sp. C8 TaxID=2762759 RepID=UPI00164357F0|nr:hypothetical protein [Pseudonocardia sp. C8]MBC3191601.1 hypothetical protein [Pseudonocardia sp. C8]